MLQEALLRVWQVAPRYRGDGRPDGLLRLSFRIARNLAVSELRRQHHEPVDIEALSREAESPDARSDPDPDLVRIVGNCRERLPAQPKRALAARLDAAGQTPDRTLAERLGMRLNTFLQNITRARRLLLDCLKRRGVDLPTELS